MSSGLSYECALPLKLSLPDPGIWVGTQMGDSDG
jgi:hypothetical protein